MLNRILAFLRACTPEVRRAFYSLMFVAFLLPIWTIISGFGHVQFFVWWLPLWFLYLVGMAFGYWYALRGIQFSPAWIGQIVPWILVIISLTGMMDKIIPGAGPGGADRVVVGPLRYLGPIIGVLCGEAAAIVLGVFAFTGTFLGLGTIAPITPQLDFPEVKKNAQEAFKGFAIAAFWLGLFAGAVGVGAPRFPWELTLGILLLAVIAIPGNLALLGDTAFRVTFYVTIAVLIGAVLGAVWYLANTLIPGIFEPPTRYLVAALVIAVFYGACLAISFNLKQGWLYTTGEIVSLLLVVSVACLWFFYDGGKEKLDALLGVPDSGGINARALTWGVMYATLILNVLYGLSGLVITKNKIRLLFGLVFFSVVLGATHLIDGMFWENQPLKGEYQELLKKSGFGK